MVNKQAAKQHHIPSPAQRERGEPLAGPVVGRGHSASPLILASSSRYRVELFARLRLPFEALAPHLDESVLPEETAEPLTRRLALAKAQVLAQRHPGRWVLGSDQAAECAGRILGKPGTQERAVQQLEQSSGQAVRFYTAVTLVREGLVYTAMDLTKVQFRVLPRAQIERYLAAEAVLDCAGSFKCEGLGISLFKSIETRDPTALMGLPLIATCQLLRQAGFELP